MTATPGGASTHKSKMLPIRQALSSLKKLPAGPKAALIEVCELYENGGKESCWITNQALAERLGSHPITVSRNLLWLFDAGLLDVRHRPDLGNRRELVPTLATRAAYSGEQDAAEAQALLANRSGSKQNAKSPEHSKVLRPSYQNAKRVLAKTQGGLSETAKSCLRAMTSNDEQETSKGGAPRAESDLGQVADLPGAAPLPPAEPQLPTWLRRPVSDFSPALSLPFDTDTFRAAWVKWRLSLLELGKPYRGDISEQQALLELGRQAAGDEARAVAIINQSIGREWTGFYPLKSDENARKHSRSNGRVSTAERYRAPQNDSYGDL
ncbi:hypothetical protein LJ737_19780 [Hymenobacter sp. 15J16-1T3B]|uniref:hypothetical protein n=1 Tax=Hymenobacter sp. 15J16-1T3B TaxID=2886941 RepID=UPI001D106EF0|nr:hypothetical protein [Hymenobacter sp. 15J16-1T3B]MCC3159492.1 hypothetical protein [Hymenobacter sp. 15J16-1T3B]